ncbi:zinc finger protein 135 isoform X2 [Oreochromis niloticus]|uniref:zinc finger protein 135 isoform X2 n=1 Tax=Oreochromis niloticus TaxID=8128 RepID=UPI000DF2A618|nr:zinc finger protein 135 isoform X2 [Oreochromis niloticus]
MPSVQYLREFINERLTAAAEQIFLEFEKTIVQYEEEIDRQRRLLDITWKPQIKLHRTDVPQQQVCEEEEEVLPEQQLWNQERSSSVDQEEPEPPQIKEEQEELCSSQEGEQLGLKEETEVHNDPVQYEEEMERQRRLLDITWKPQIKLHRTDVPQQHVCKEEEEEVLPEQQLWNQERSSSVDQEEPEPPQIKEEQEELCSSQEGEQLGLKEETDTFMVTAAEEGEHSEPGGDEEQLLCHSFAGAESQDQEGGRSADSGPTRIIYRIHCNNPAHARMLARQKNSDAGKKTLKCDVCGRAFKKKCQVKEHRKIHTGEKPHSCKVCQRSFTQKSTMLRHMIIHTKEKSYSCLTCGKTFSQSGNLYVHMRIHTGEKPYSCKTCGKTFARSNHMLRHMKTHTGEKS